jgi:hypothetical protein
MYQGGKSTGAAPWTFISCPSGAIHHQRVLPARRNPHLRYNPIAHGTNVLFSQPINLHLTACELWLSANFATSEPALVAANCPCPLAVFESTDVPRTYGDTIMKRTSLIVAILVFAVSNAGCGCCSWLCHRPAPCAPACPPPAPVCNPCATAPVTYGAPVAPYAPPPQW